jgi:hypothetical protein
MEPERRSSAASVIQHILQSSLIGDPNVPVAPGTSTTALHVASEIGRADAGMFCFECPRLTMQYDFSFFIPRSTIQYGTSKDGPHWNAPQMSKSLPSLRVSERSLSKLTADSRTALQLQYKGLLVSYVGSSLSSLDESSEMAAFLQGPRSVYSRVGVDISNKLGLIFSISALWTKRPEPLCYTKLPGELTNRVPLISDVEICDWWS